MSPAIDPSEKRKSDVQLLDFADLPHWQQDNHYILTHYRSASYSFARSLKSLFYLHNEFVNIHTHLFGTVIFIYFFLYYCPPSAQSSLNAEDQLPFSEADGTALSFFYVGAVLCLLISASFHALSNHSPRVAKYGNQLDYVGIVALITGSFIPSVYYGFYCDRHLQKTYWAMISTLAVGCAIVSVSPKFRTPKWRPFRAGMFVAMGLSAIVPVLHGLRRYGFRQMEYQIGLSWLVLQGVLYIVGAGLYAVGLRSLARHGSMVEPYLQASWGLTSRVQKARIPERWQPGRFDLWGSSHQIFHVLIVLAALSHLKGLTVAAHHAHTPGRCDPAMM
ncbi:hypothetical protein MMC17_000234 [Xylographa soralifera]|nr:hypothetical protein [Xylographa soralifera]